jgi:23S rRNA pseudouridine1911/1915/1917 synthase
MDIPILFENESIVAVNKPSGLTVHPDGRTIESTLSDWVLARYPETEHVGEPIQLSSGEVIRRPGIVHRLDKETSGVLLIAKTAEAFEALKRQFQDRSIQKTYRAFLFGRMKETDGVIDRSIGRSRSDFRLWSAQRGAKGTLRDAVTEYRVLDTAPDFSYVEIEPKTGRTHQIRVHFKAINHPVVGDRLYAPKRGYALGFSRTALHAERIAFTLLDGAPVSVEAPLPEDFVAATALFASLKGM